jgi:hypothetical protein
VAGKTVVTGEVLPRAPRRARRQLAVAADPDAVVALAAAAADGLPIYATVVADTGTDPAGEAVRWAAAHTAWNAELTGWAP